MTIIYSVPGTNPVTVKAARLILVVLATVKWVLESFTLSEKMKCFEIKTLVDVF